LENTLGGWGNVVDFFKWLPGQLWADLQKYWGYVVNFFVGVGDWFVNIWTSMVGGLKTAWGAVAGFFETLWEGIKSVAATVWGGILVGIKSVINGIIWIINKMITAANAVDFLDLFADIPYIQKIESIGGYTGGFAYGGVVPGSPNEEVMIMAHGGERYLGAGSQGPSPFRDNNGGGFRDLHLHNPVIMGTRKDAQRWWDFIKQAARSDKRFMEGQATW
jgi:hypothetical protein